MSHPTATPLSTSRALAALPGSLREGQWLDGEVLACACPDCGVPMSVRLWLMTADCWQCGLSIDLSEAMLGVGGLGLGGGGEKRPPQTRGHRSKARPTTARLPPPQFPPPTPQPPIRSPRSPAPSPVAAPPVQSRLLLYRATDWLTVAPAWLVSMIVHMLLLLLLSLIPLREPERPLRITLLTTISPYPRDGGDDRPSQPEQEVAFDLPLDPPQPSRPPRELLQAQRDAQRLRVTDEAARKLPDLESVRMMLTSDSPDARLLAARDPRLRPLIVTREGGTVWTEAAVARGLYWLAQHQNDDGSWSLDRFDESPKCRGRCDGCGRYRGKMAGTSLALLPFLGAGQTPHVECLYQDVVRRGLDWLVGHQDRRTGELRYDATGDKGMYVHGQATIVLCEALALTQDKRLRKPAQAAVDFVVEAQHPRGGWRYGPGEAGDTSVLGWQLMALHSARSAGLHVPSAALLLAEQYLERAEVPGQPGRYCYFPGGNHQQRQASPAMTAEALLCRFYLGTKRDDPRVRQGIYYLLDNPPQPGRDLNAYYLYYATQTLHHWGGEAWEEWNLRMRDALVSAQETRGHEAGSWSLAPGPYDAHARRHDLAGGRLYLTSLAVCTLEVYYRHAPLFRRIELDE